MSRFCGGWVVASSVAPGGHICLLRPTPQPKRDGLSVVPRTRADLPYMSRDWSRRTIEQIRLKDRKEAKAQAKVITPIFCVNLDLYVL